MTANNPALPISAGNKVKLRSHNQITELGMVIGRPATVYLMRINQVFITVDRIIELAFDGGGGVAADIFVGMTLLVSGVGAGGHDKGVCRVRGITFTSAGVGVIEINETSNIKFEDNDYLTVVESMSIWQRDIVTIGGSDYYFDANIAYNITMGRAIGRIGPPVAIVDIDPDTLVAEFHPVEPDRSACYDGSTVASYEYFCPGAISIVDDIYTVAPTMTFDAAGQYLWWVEITDSLGRVTNTYRWVYVNPTSEQFKILKCSGDLSSSNWTVKVRTSADMSTIYDRAMVTLYTIYESYNGVEGFIGKLPGYENIKVTGWIDGATIYMNTVEGYSEFEVKGAAFWASKLRAFPFGVDDTSVDPVDWVHIQELTVDKALAHMLFWTTTMPAVMDCFFSDSTLRFKELVSPAQNLWQQITDMTLSTIFAHPLVNSLGQMFVEIDQQIVSDADRALLPVIQHLEKYDYQTGMGLQVNKENNVSLLFVSGVAWDGTTSSPFFSKAPGSIGSTYGEPREESNYGFPDQAECNRVAGRLYALMNNPYDPIDLELVGQNSFFDVAPRQFASIDIDAIDNPLGIDLTSQLLIPRSVELEYDEDTLFLKTVVSFEFVIADVNAPVGITYVPPSPVLEDLRDNYSFGKIRLPKLPNSGLGSYFPPYVPTPNTLPASPCSDYGFNKLKLAWDKTVVRYDDADKTARVYLPCKLHSTGDTRKPSKVSGWTNVSTGARVHLYALKDGSRVASANPLGEFELTSQLDVDGFEIEVEFTGGLVRFTGGYSPSEGSMTFELLNPWVCHYVYYPNWTPYGTRLNIGIASYGAPSQTAELTYYFKFIANAPGASGQNASREFGPIWGGPLGTAVWGFGDTKSFYISYNLVIWTGVSPYGWANRSLEGWVFLSQAGYSNQISVPLPYAQIENVCSVTA